ncbi:MAG: hypothetical protein HC875_34360 [Anaerolineales bacterium]|nr:hypothetical protein [Anaerolineales bacterium]
MVECECLPRCLFFNDKMTEMPVTAERLKKKYCLTDNSRCARFMVFKALGREKVPIDLFPQNLDRAHQLIAAG